MRPAVVEGHAELHGAIDPSKVIDVIGYDHPVFTPAAIEAQKRHREVNGARRTYYCGAYWRYGFHEDGVVSALNALEHFEEDRPADGTLHEERYLLRAS